MESSALNGSVTYNTFVQQGWQCPICKRVFAPFISECPYCGDNLKCVTTATPDGGVIATGRLTRKYSGQNNTYQ